MATTAAALAAVFGLPANANPKGDDAPVTIFAITADNLDQAEPVGLIAP